jgi:hypothetical protein
MQTNTIRASQVHPGAVAVPWCVKFKGAPHLHEIAEMLSVSSPKPVPFAPDSSALFGPMHTGLSFLMFGWLATFSSSSAFMICPFAFCECLRSDVGSLITVGPGKTLTNALVEVPVAVWTAVSPHAVLSFPVQIHGISLTPF